MPRQMGLAATCPCHQAAGASSVALEPAAVALAVAGPHARSHAAGLGLWLLVGLAGALPRRRGPTGARGSTLPAARAGGSEQRTQAVGCELKVAWPAGMRSKLLP